MTTRWGDVFDRYAIKAVSDNDKIKRAYVPSQEQTEVLEAAGLTPADGGPAPQFAIRVLGDPARRQVDASYYRASGHPQRELRIGRDFIGDQRSLHPSATRPKRVSNRSQPSRERRAFCAARCRS